jgi:aspartate-semialdehyde dehydrogenase
LLGATGAVGQRYITMLSGHPLISLEVVMGNRSANKKYGEAVQWLSAEPIPEEFAAKKILESSPESADGCDVIFSALPAHAANDIEMEFARAGFTVVSEASAHRMNSDVPLMIPEVNAEHLKLLDLQRRNRSWKGSLVTTPNCTVTGLAIVLKPIVQNFNCSRVIVTSMQAVSGAGFPGVSSMLIVENVIPYIEGEEEKVARETTKILGKLKDGGVTPVEIPMALSCNRVPVLDGHLETLYVELNERVTPEEVAGTLDSFVGPPQEMRLPTAPDRPIIVRKEKDRPQPRLDRLSGSVPGMSVVVGRIRRGIDDRSIQMTLLSHNTIRGAAGNAILTLELMARKGYV